MTARRSSPPICRRTALRLAAERAGIARWSSDIAPVRGKCRGGTKRRPCKSRYGIVRVSLDFRSPDRVDRLATIECAGCGRTWRRIKPPAIRSAEGYQRVLLTLVIPATSQRWYSRGHWHRDGDDAQVLVNADLPETDDAIRAWQGRVDKRDATRARARIKREESDAAAVERTRTLLAASPAGEAAEREAEREATERENAYRA